MGSESGTIGAAFRDGIRVDPVTRAIDDYHALLRDERALARGAGGALLRRACAPRSSPSAAACCCPFPRPNLVSAGRLRADPRRVPRASSRRSRRWKRRLGQRALGPRGPHAGGARAGGHRPRLPALLAQLAARFLPDHLLLPVRGAERGDARPASPTTRCSPTSSWSCRSSRSSRSATRCAASARASGCWRRSFACYREAGGRAERPTHRDRGLRGRAHAHGAPPVPRVLQSRAATLARVRPAPPDLRGRGGCATTGRAIDIVYKRLLVNEFLERREELGALSARPRATARW